MSIANKLTKLQTDISNAYAKIGDRGGTVPASKNTDNLVNAIDSIPSGGGVVEPPEKDVNFYTYDGIRTNSYTKDEFLALNSMPANPTYDMLTSQGWNWALSDAKTYVTTYGGLDIGDIADSTDGALYIYINLEVEDRLSPSLVVNLQGTINIDWGDGNTEQGTHDSTATFWSIQHTYASTGQYRIKVSKANDNTSFNLRGGSFYQGSSLISDAYDSTVMDGSNARAYYNSTITKIIMPSAFTSSIPNASFSNCISLESINIPQRITAFGQRAFYNCFKLKCLTIKESAFSVGSECLYNSGLNVLCCRCAFTTGGNALNGSQLKKFWLGLYTGGAVGTYSNCFNNSRLIKCIIPLSISSIGQSSFNLCSALVKIKFAGNITALGSSAFNRCYSLATMDFSNNTQIPTLGSSALNGCPSDMKIIVPDNLYTSWIADSNWSTYASQIVKASEV